MAHPETGQEGYRVGMEVFHQLHCLNLLRRVTFKEYYEPLGGEFAAGPDALQHHTGEFALAISNASGLGLNDTHLLFDRSLHRDSQVEHPVQCGHRPFHAVHGRRRSTGVAGAQHEACMQEFRRREAMGTRPLCWEYGAFGVNFPSLFD